MVGDAHLLKTQGLQFPSCLPFLSCDLAHNRLQALTDTVLMCNIWVKDGIELFLHSGPLLGFLLKTF